MSASDTLLELLACEVVSSLGECAAETALLMDAGIVNLAPSRFVGDDGARIAMCSAPALVPDLLGTDRLASLGGLALERLAGLPAANSLRGVTNLLLCLPERMARQDGGFELTPDGSALMHALGRLPRLRGVAIEPFPFGRAAGALSLQRATQLASQGRRVLWGGIDSQHDWAVLQALAASARLLTEDNVDGIRPGEAAAFALLQRAEGGARPVILGSGLGRQAPVDDEAPAIRADGLARAVRSATALLRDQHRRCGYWMFDTTHEDLAVQRLQHILTACHDIVGTRTTLNAPLQLLGDAGAASLPLFAALADQGWRHGIASDDIALLAACADSGACGAILLGQTLAKLSI